MGFIERTDDGVKFGGDAVKMAYNPTRLACRGRGSYHADSGIGNTDGACRSHLESG